MLFYVMVLFNTKNKAFFTVVARVWFDKKHQTCLSFYEKVLSKFSEKTLNLVFTFVPIEWTTVEYPGFDLTADVNFVNVGGGWVFVEH